MPLLEARKQYKPFEYPWAFEYWKRQQQIHWMPEEVPLGEDCRDWAQKLDQTERNLLTQIFRFFTQADVEVQDCYHDKYGRVFKPTEIKMMLTAFSNMETVHIAAYSHLLDTIGMPESEYSAFLQYKEMKDKHDYLSTFGVDSDEDIAKTLAMFGGFTEGLQLFASFAMLMNFPRFNKMKGMGQIVSWSVRDESLHCEGIIKLFHTFVKERNCLTRRSRRTILDICQKTVRLEDAFIDLAFEMGPVNGMSPKEIKKYIRYIADWRLGQLGFAPIYMVDEHPLPWLAPLLNGVEHANFFETRATEYSKAATRGNWNERLGQFRPAAEGEGRRGERRRERRRRAGYVRGGWGCGGVKDPMEMNDGEYRLYHARTWAARVYQAEGFDDFAERVERGEADDCSQVRLAQFFVEPPQTVSSEFVAAWEEAARQVDTQ